MLTPEDLATLKPRFEEIRKLLEAANAESSGDELSDETRGCYLGALTLMESLVEDVSKKQGYSVKDAFLKRVGSAAKSPEGAGVIGGVAAGAAVPTFVTGLGGFGVAAGGSAFGVAGLAGATAATGGAALAGAAGAYLAYRAGAAMLDTELGQKAKDSAKSTGEDAIGRARSAVQGTIDRFRQRPPTVYQQFRHAFSEDQGWMWLRQEGMGGTGRFGGCWKLQYRAKATIYFRDEESGNVARIAGQASYFPPALRDYLSQNVPAELENRHRDYCIAAEHSGEVIRILRDGT